MRLTNRYECMNHSPILSNNSRQPSVLGLSFILKEWFAQLM